MKHFLFFLIVSVYMLVGCGHSGSYASFFSETPPTSTLSYQEAKRNFTGLSLVSGGTVYHNTGSSMLPAFGQGTLLLARREPFNSISEGQLIVWNRNGETVFHRVVEVSYQGVLTKGISNHVCDRPWVTPESYLGTVYAVAYYKEEAL